MAPGAMPTKALVDCLPCGRPSMLIFIFKVGPKDREGIGEIFAEDVLRYFSNSPTGEVAGTSLGVVAVLLALGVGLVVGPAAPELKI